jgi:hypothetical protein
MSSKGPESIIAETAIFVPFIRQALPFSYEDVLSRSVYKALSGLLILKLQKSQSGRFSASHNSLRGKTHPPHQNTALFARGVRGWLADASAGTSAGRQDWHGSWSALWLVFAL